MLRVRDETRERVLRIGQEEFGGVFADETVRRLIDESDPDHLDAGDGVVAAILADDRDLCNDGRRGDERVEDGDTPLPGSQLGYDARERARHLGVDGKRVPGRFDCGQGG
jgi:hypothetical protein